MKRQLDFSLHSIGKALLIVVFAFLIGCQSETAANKVSLQVEPTVTTAVSATDIPPTPLPEPTPAQDLITSVEEMAGIWLGTVAGERGYVMYTEDGRYTVALIQDDLGIAPRVSGEYWFEDGTIHLRDLENAGHWVVCDAEIVGIYEAVVLEDGNVQFQTGEDGCKEGGFTRNYIFANMMQERIDDPVPIAEAEAEAKSESNPELAAALQAIIDQAVADGAPGAVLMVDAPGMGFTWKGAAGMADPDAGVEMSVDDPFIISSGTKMFTAVTLLKLVEEGKLDLDDPISQYLPEDLIANLLLLDGESYGETITVRQLLNHTSGLGDFSNGPDTDGSGLPDFKDLVLNEPDTMWDVDTVLAWAVENISPVSIPGEGFHYSDTNFQLLGLIIENASGLSLHEAYRQFIFEPLDMNDTYMEFYEEGAPEGNGSSVSQAYYAGTNWNDLDSHSYEWGSGGLVSTADDQNRFMWALVNDEIFEDPASKEAMMTWGDTGDPGNYYGLGLWHFVIEEWDIPGLGEAIGHGGIFNSHAHYWPDQNVMIMGTLNSNEPQFGFVFQMLGAMGAIQASAAE